MSRYFFPSREADVVTWSTNFKTKIVASPTTYNLTAAMATQYSAAHDAFVSAYQTANNPDTRSPSAIVAKDQALENLANEARTLVRLVQAGPLVTNEERSELGIPVYDREPTTVPVPAFAPLATIVSAVGRTVTLKLQDATSPTRRGKPAGVAGAAVYSFVGDNPPADLSEWKYEASTTRTSFQVVFPASVPNWSKVHLAARWFNPRLQNGPAVTVETALPGGNAVAA